MPTPSSPLKPLASPATRRRLALGAALLLAAAGALAERADRSKPLTLESDQPCVVSLQKQTSVCSGNVSITQGTLQIRADRLELRETPEGHQLAQASGGTGKLASYRQKRDSSDEVIEGQALRIDYDSKAGTLRFDGQAQVRRVLAGVQADEITGALIVWNSLAETFSISGGAPSAGNPSGRVRAVISPRVAPEAAAPSSPAASALRATPALGDRR